MKKKRLFAAILLSLSLSACASSAPSETRLPEATNPSTAPSENRSVDDSRVYVDISTHGDGFYSLMSKVKIHYYEGNIGYIEINDPTLLAFQVSSAYNGGAWLMDLEEGQNVMNELSDVVASLRASGEYELAEKIENAIDILSRSGPFTKAST